MKGFNKKSGKGKTCINTLIILIILMLFNVIWIIPAAKGEINIFKSKSKARTANKNFINTKIKSANLSTDYKIDVVLKDIEKLGLNTVNIPIVVDIKTLSSNTMSVNKESQEKAIKLINKLKGKNINIILEPYPWIKNGELYETQWKPTDINEFFINWKNNVLKVLIDNVAVPYNVEALNVASNFIQMEYAEGYWCDTIDFVRKYYKGLVTYRTCWWYTAEWDEKTQKNYENKLNNKLFSKVDFISVGAYFELSEKDVNTVEELVSHITDVQRYDRGQNVKEELYKLNKKWNKPIFFGELGFPKRNRAAVEPWNPLPSTVINDEEQARCFEAYRKVFEKEKWILGFSVFAVGEDSKEKTYYPSEKSAEVIRKWYK